MNQQLIAIALACDLLLLAAKALMPRATRRLLPIGGDHLIQIGVLLVLAVAFGTLWGVAMGRPPF